MSEYISREDLLKEVGELNAVSFYELNEHSNDAYHDIKNLIEHIPSVDVVEQKTGKWEYDPNGMDWGIGAWVCSECGGRNDMIPAVLRGADGHEQKVNPYRWAGSKFCPNCGARMVER